MAGTVTVAEKTVNSIKEILFTWVSSSDTGAADAVTTCGYDGELITVLFVPDSGDTQPDNSYDVTLVDNNSIDVLGGLGVNLSNAANVLKKASDGLLPVSGSKLTLAVSGAGNSNGGKIRVSIR